MERRWSRVLTVWRSGRPGELSVNNQREWNARGAVFQQSGGMDGQGARWEQSGDWKKAGSGST